MAAPKRSSGKNAEDAVGGGEREEPLSAREETLRRPSGAPVLQPSNLELRRYFNRIDRFLKDKKHSHCAWEIVRVEIRRCFYFFQKLTALLRRR